MPILEYRRLTADEIAEGLTSLPHWASDGNQLARTFSFDTYLEGVSFTCAVAYLAEKLNHHPDLTVGYRKVTVKISTHDVGGLSPFDFELARRIDSLS